MVSDDEVPRIGALGMFVFHKKRNIFKNGTKKGTL